MPKMLTFVSQRFMSALFAVMSGIGRALFASEQHGHGFWMVPVIKLFIASSLKRPVRPTGLCLIFR
jgi:hypothetical protein